MTFSAETVGVGVFVLWFGLAFALPGSWTFRWLGGLVLGVMVAAFVAALSGRGPTQAPPATATAVVPQGRAHQSLDARPVTPPQSAPAAALTAAQRNAVRSAESYLQMSGFSRRGLIDQLSSEYGSQFAVADATAAVDSMGIDWNAQAARSAATYLQMSGFSCRGLIDQLTSDYGSKYTVEQATYGAKQAGAC